MNAALAVYRNADDEVSGEVFESGIRQGGFGDGKFAAALRDDATGQIVGCTVHGFKTFDEAAAEARRMAGLVPIDSTKEAA